MVPLKDDVYWYRIQVGDSADRQVRKGYQGGYSNLSSSTLNRVLGISIEENCLFWSSVVALRRSDKLSMLERWEKPLVQISPLTTSRWISSCISCHYLWLQSFCKLNIGFKNFKTRRPLGLHSLHYPIHYPCPNHNAFVYFFHINI